LGAHKSLLFAHANILLCVTQETDVNLIIGLMTGVDSISLADRQTMAFLTKLRATFAIIIYQYSLQYHR
jgi:hypothetical protein